MIFHPRGFKPYTNAESLSPEALGFFARVQSVEPIAITPRYVIVNTNLLRVLRPNARGLKKLRGWRKKREMHALMEQIRDIVRAEDASL